ncbi:MAG: YajD family HNH nuclease [Acidiferrobacterales bacterium]
MTIKKSAPRKAAGRQPNREKLDRVVAQAVKARDERMLDYRERALKIHPWVCTRCGREFTRENLYELTVHHKDHNHDNNPPDGSNWELLCRYCHDNEHSRYIDDLASKDRSNDGAENTATYKPFANLKEKLKGEKD